LVIFQFLELVKISHQRFGSFPNSRNWKITTIVFEKGRCGMQLSCTHMQNKERERGRERNRDRLKEEEEERERRRGRGLDGEGEGGGKGGKGRGTETGTDTETGRNREGTETDREKEGRTDKHREGKKPGYTLPQVQVCGQRRGQ
jgi:hypothetical protein